jgi:cytoskeletal protein RodZ
VKSKSQKRFGLLPGVLLVFVLVVAGFGGFYMYKLSNKRTIPPIKTTDNYKPNEQAPDVAKIASVSPSGTSQKADLQDEDSTSNTYEDPVWHYSFDYPKTWRVDSKNGDVKIFSPDFYVKDSAISDDAMSAGSVIKISMNARDARIVSLDDFEQKEVAGYKGSSKIKLDGNDAIEVYMDTENNSRTTLSMLYRQHSYVSVSYEYVNGGMAKYLTTYQSVINTFKIVP